jgi:hypothetical protein
MLDASIFTAKLLKVSLVAAGGYVQASRSRGGEPRMPLTHMHFVALNCEILAN